MSGDELDRTIEFLLQNAARSAARFDALHEQNLQEYARLTQEHARLTEVHARLAQEQATFQLQLRDLGDHVTVMTETLTTTLTAMNERDARQDRRLANLDFQFNRVESQIEQLAKLVHAHVSDPHAHGHEAG